MKLLIATLFISFMLPLFAGCQSLNTDILQATNDSTVSVSPTGSVDKPTADATDATRPVAAGLDLTMENIKTYVVKSITFAEVKDMFGKNDANTSSDPINCPQRVWFLDNNGYKGTYLEIKFLFPGYDQIDQWYESMNLPTETNPNGDSYYYVDEGNFLGTWTQNMEAVSALIRKDNKTIDVLFGEDYYNPNGT